MAKKPDITTIASGYYSRQALNTNFENLRDKFDNTLSLDGSTPNSMGADLDMNSNDILNASEIDTSSLRINGVLDRKSVVSGKSVDLGGRRHIIIRHAQSVRSAGRSGSFSAETS